MKLKNNELRIENLDDLQPQAAIRKTDIEDLKENLSRTGSYIFYQDSFDILNLMVTDKNLAMELLEEHAKHNLHLGMDNGPDHEKKYLKLAKKPTRAFIKNAEKFFMRKTDDSENYAAYLMGLFNWDRKKAFGILKKAYTREVNQYKNEMKKDEEEENDGTYY